MNTGDFRLRLNTICFNGLLSCSFRRSARHIYHSNLVLYVGFEPTSPWLKAKHPRPLDEYSIKTLRNCFTRYRVFTLFVLVRVTTCRLATVDWSMFFGCIVWTLCHLLFSFVLFDLVIKTRQSYIVKRLFLTFFY